MGRSIDIELFYSITIKFKFKEENNNLTSNETKSVYTHIYNWCMMSRRRGNERKKEGEIEEEGMVEGGR